MGFRAALVLAAAVLPRTAALRPNIRGGRILEAAADACPVDDCCPAKLEPIPASECPPPDSGDVARFSCDAPDLVEGNLCRSNAGECGTDKNLDNCEYPETKLKADIYRVIEARPVAPSPKPTSICPELIPLEKDSPDCPDELDIAPCDTPGLTGFCEGDGGPARRRPPTSPRRPTGTWTATRTRTWAAASPCTRPCSRCHHLPISGRAVSLFAQRRVPHPS